MSHLQEDPIGVADDVLNNANKNITSRPMMVSHRPTNDKTSEVTITLQQPTPKWPASKDEAPVHYFEDQTSNDHIAHSMSVATITPDVSKFNIGTKSGGEASDEQISLGAGTPTPGDQHRESDQSTISSLPLS